MLLPGLLPETAEAALRWSLAQQGGCLSEVGAAAEQAAVATSTKSTTWREWTTALPEAPALAWWHQTFWSGLPLTVVQTRGDVPWNPELARLLSARSGGFVLSGEDDSRRSTWGLILCHDGRVVRWRRQAQVPGTESDLGPIWHSLWAGAVQQLIGMPASLLGPELTTPVMALPLPGAGGDARVPRPADDPAPRWRAVLVDVDPAAVDQLLDGRASGARVYHGLADPELPAVSARFSVARGPGAAPPAPLEAALRNLDPELVVLRDGDAAEPWRFAAQAQRLKSAPGIFVAPSGDKQRAGSGGR
jgi:hypothetical protein